MFRKETPLDPYLKSQKKSVTLVPLRGDILDTKGRVLATSTTLYDIYLDPCAPCDTLWDNNIAALCSSLENLFKDKTASQYRKLLQDARDSGTRYLKFRKNLDQIEINHIRRMPIFRKGRNKGGYIEESRHERLYPYGTSAYRTIGYVKNNSDTVKRKKGIEGQFDELLHGTDGVQIERFSDYGMIPVTSSENKKAVNGKDIRCTIDIDIQNIAEQALRKKVEESELIEKSCVIVLETKTGAIRAMVNLGRSKKGSIGEWDNYALRNAEAPGSVFKGAVMMALLEDGYVTTFEKEVPTYGGKWSYNGQGYDDTKHLGRHRFPSGRVKIRQAFEMSANNTFRQLVCDERHYGNNPKRFVEKIKGLGIIDTIDFDLPGITPPFILDPSMKRPTPKGFWDGGTLPRMAIGYCMELSPLNIVTFYNAIACGGKMMKPYLIESIEENGHPVQTFSPTVMHESICTKRTADTLKTAMGKVASDKGGTAYYQLHDAICPIAGKTGTAQRVFKKSNGRYGYFEGKKESQQATFVGFFPQNNPEYTAIVVMWSLPSEKNFFGASYSAPVFREIADKIYCLNDNL